MIERDMSSGSGLKHRVPLAAGFRFATVVLLIVLAHGPATTCHAGASGERTFPVPRAEAELRRIRPIAMGVGADGPVELDLYLALTGPYAPLDLQVTKSANAEEASFLRNYYLGVTARETGVAEIADLLNAFHCESCSHHRRAFALEHLDAMKQLVALLERAENVHLVAEWGQSNSFRVNEMFKIGGRIREAIPSETMGFIPSGRWNDFPDVSSFFVARGIRESSVMRLVGALAAIPAAAAVRSSNQTARVLLFGIGDNEAGVLFQPPEAPIPTVGSKLKDGTEFRIIEVLEPGVIYYETT